MRAKKIKQKAIINRKQYIGSLIKEVKNRNRYIEIVSMHFKV